MVTGITQLGPKFQLVVPGGNVSTLGGTVNYVPKWTPDGFTLGNSQIQDNGTEIGIRTAPVVGTAVSLTSTGNTSLTTALSINNAVALNLFSILDDTSILAGRLATGVLMIGRGYVLPGGINNTGYGIGNFTVASTGTYNTAVGFGSLALITTGSFVTATGALSAASVTTLSNSVFYGAQAGQQVQTGNASVFVGAFTGYMFTTVSNDNTLVGYGIMSTGAATTGQGNAITGASSFIKSTGSYNSSFGANVAISATTGNFNVFGGYGVGYSGVLIGDGNIWFGSDAGGDQFTVSPPTTNGLSYSIAIGSSTRPTASHQMVVGGIDGYIDTVYFGNNPTATVPVNVTFRGTGGYGADVAGASSTYAPGVSTGNANNGSFIIATGDKNSTSSSTLNPLSNKLTVSQGTTNGIIFTLSEGTLSNITGAASGTETGIQFSLTATNGHTSGSYTKRAFNFVVGGTCNDGVTVTEALGGIVQTSMIEAVTVTGGVSKATALRLIALGGNAVGPNTMTELCGIDVQVGNRSKITTNVFAFKANVNSSVTGAVTQAVAYEIVASWFASANVTNWSGLRIPAIAGPTGAIYGLDITGTMNNRIAGKLAIGSTTAPTATLEVTGTIVNPDRLDTNLRRLYKSGPIKMLDWELGETYAAVTGVRTMSWSGRKTYDSTDTPSIDWEARTLKNNASADTLDWKNCAFTNQAWTFDTDRGIFLTNQTDSAGAGLGTITNAPHAGDPDFWVKIKVNGTNVAFPVWNG